MSYNLNWVPSPNFTPGAQTQAFYGRPRTIEIGAGHWWNWPRSGAQHDGIVNYMANPGRQAAPHAVLSAGRVTEMVRPWDTAWCTSNANPYTYAIETDPRIMFKWGSDNPSPAERQLGEQIFQTLAEYIADKGYHTLPWRAHNQLVSGTQCNPIPWDEVRARANQIVAERQTPEWKKNLQQFSARRLRVKAGAAGDLLNLNNVNESIKKLAPGTEIDFKGYTDVGGHRYYLSAYAFDNGQANGMREWELEPIPAPEPPKPEWILNLRDIEPVKLMVMPAEGTSIVNLNDLSVIAPLAKGTWVDFKKSTTVQGVEYLISSYSADRAMPNGIRRDHVAVPADPPVSEKPAWLENWQDIENVTMYTRVDAPLVNLLDGSTIKTIPINTPIEVGSTTEWLEGNYAITEYSTQKKLAQGILIAHLDDEPIKEPETPVEPAPEQPTIEDRLNWLERAVRAILSLLNIKL